VSEEDRKAAESLSAQAWQLWGQRKLPEAEELFKKSLAKDPADANAWNGLGWAQQNQNKQLNAKDAFRKCLELEPEHAAALNGMGWVAKTEGRTDEAIQWWEKAVKSSPDATASLFGLAQTHMELKHYDKAVQYYQELLEFDPANTQAKAELERALKAGGPDTATVVGSKSKNARKTRKRTGGKWFLAGSNRGDYEVKPEAGDVEAKDRWTLRSTTATPTGFGTIMKNIPADEYRGKRVRMSALIQSAEIAGWAGMWMRVDGPDSQVLSFDNMQSRPIKGTRPARKYEIVLDVPEASLQIAHGVLLFGGGQIWISDLKFEAVEPDTPTTGAASR
jgi:tetratricopeptide (TPR) repeat protein